MTVLDNEGSVLDVFGTGKLDLDTEKLMNRIIDDLHPKQRAFVNDTETEIIGLSAGYGAGKTRSLCAKATIIQKLV